MKIITISNIHNVDNYTEFLLDLIGSETKFTNNPMSQIINSLLKHVNEQMEFIGKDLDSIKEMNLKY